MGWNSWICYGATVTEAELEATASYMARELREYGWEYVVIDGGWAMPGQTTPVPSSDTVVTHHLDPYGRLLPDPDRFPSSVDGVGFKAIGDTVHRRGLKLGIHIMRGVPRKAVALNTPILGTSYRARDIADTKSICRWSPDMYGIDMSHPGGQAYYDSIVSLYTGWGVDYIKADDMSSPYYAEEIQALARAIGGCGREIVLSLSPGNCLPEPRHIDHALSHCELWRVSPDFWDSWDGGQPHFSSLKAHFDLCQQTVGYAGPGHWSDADMLPLGRIGPRPPEGVDRATRFTPDEQVTLMSLWAIARSPLMMGGDLPSLDPWTLSLLTNPEVLAVNQKSTHNQELCRDGDRIAWTARAPDASEYLALFNLGDRPASMGLPLAARARRARDLWKKKDAGPLDAVLRTELPPHGSLLLQLR
jgi:alpha-galactosidase